MHQVPGSPVGRNGGALYQDVEERLWKIIVRHQSGWDGRLPLFLLAYRAATHDTTGLTPACLVFGRELQLPCNWLFGALPDKEWPTTGYAADLVDHLCDIHNYAGQHLKMASDRMKTRYDKLANSTGYQEGDRIRLYRPTHKKGKSPNLNHHRKAHTITWINDVVYRIQ
jgi:hypothetical protein